MNSLRNWFEQMMAGRYGIDDLSRFQLGVMVVLMIVSLFVRIPILNTLFLLMLVWSYFRIFSRNTAKRYEENVKFLRWKDRWLPGGTGGGWSMDKLKKTWKDRSKNHIYRCPQCRQKIRIPRGRGKIVITCPKCRTEFTRRS